LAESLHANIEEFPFRGDFCQRLGNVHWFPQVPVRGMRGTYQHCKEKHLHRYLAEFDFRFNHRAALGFTDGERAAATVRNASGKRLTYRPTSQT
jgi:hypothetical protein